MNRVDLLLATPAVSLQRFDHPDATEHDDPEYEVASSDSINFVEDGTFDVRMGGGRWRFAPGTIFLASQGMGFSVEHDREVPSDRCLTVTYDAKAVEELMRADVPALAPPFTHLSERQRYLRRRLRTCEAGDEMRLELLAGALFESLAAPAGPSGPRARASYSHLARCVDRAVDLIDTDFARALTLREIASAAGLSAFHFARVFRELTGLPPHRYLTAVRLRRAVGLLRDGAPATRTCYEVGFGSPSHFVTSFRRQFGVRPSEVGRGAPCPTLRPSAARASSRG